MAKLTPKSATSKFQLLTVAMVLAGCFILNACGGSSQSPRGGSSSGTSLSGSSYDREAQREMDRQAEIKREQINEEERRWNEEKRRMDAAAKSNY
jgi:hypothetical protein